MTKLNIPQPPPEAKRDVLMHTTVYMALGASIVMSGFGVGSAFWAGLVAREPAAFIALGTIGAVLAASEIGAVVVARAMVRDGLTIARGALFALTTAGNVLAAHYGAEAINTRLVAPQRAPYESAVSSAGAMLEAARNGAQAQQSRHAEETAGLERALEAERAANPLYVTARGRQAQDQRDALAARQEAERAVQATEIASATANKADAIAAQEEAPKGFDWVQMWGFALLLELLKGVLVFVASPRRRRIAAAGNVLPIDPVAYAEMDEAELNEILSRGRTASALAQHALRRLRKAA